jgi:UDP-N-acetylglucosamine transferase subunit ALG13
MILVATGASQFPFDRLLRALEGLRSDERIVAQHGVSALRPDGTECVDFVPMPELARLIREARVVVTHAGVGSILLCLTNGRRPIVVPRLKRYGETVDDHQLESARRFAAADLVTLVEDPERLVEMLLAVDDARSELAPPSGESQLVRELRGYLEATIKS